MNNKFKHSIIKIMQSGDGVGEYKGLLTLGLQTRRNNAEFGKNTCNPQYGVVSYFSNTGIPLLILRKVRQECLRRKEDRKMDLVKVLSEQQLKNDLPELKVGDTVKVHAKIKEGNRERIQVFEGIIIAKKHAGVNQTVTVRRISYGVGVEKTFPVHSPNVAKFEVVRSGKVRRAKLYYLRGRVGKAAKIAEKI